mgnify:CR=1 FL=1
MGVWIGALLSYSLALAPRMSRIFILASAAAGMGQLADELFGVLYRARTRARAQRVSPAPAEEEARPLAAPTASEEARRAA